MTDSTHSQLRSNWFHVLLALAQEGKHGSAIARDVLEQTNGGLRLWPATLYRTLDDMVRAGLLVELTGADHPDGASGRRRYYRATSHGTAELSAAAERMSNLAGTALQRLRGVKS